ncbi:MAG: low molecular weight phosphotyrosine protein phosphatase, partial [Clostridia bacterium]|nr:low molecular weight phosphotyrosine protein phosphatase [Clostridia bacterium]
MKRIMFVCLGNICRSPMAEFLMKDLLKKKNLQDDFYISSSATSTYEIGNPVHYGTKRILDKLGIDCSKKRAVLLTKSDYDKYDLFIGMDESNRRSMIRLFDGDKQNKVKLLLDYTNNPRSVADPYYTGGFDVT